MCCSFQGSLPDLNDIKEAWISDHTESCEAKGMDMADGMGFFASINCVNNIELAAIATSMPVYITLHEPNKSKAVIDIIPISKNTEREYFSGVATPIDVQSNESCIVFHWDGFEDVTPIAGYGYEMHDFNNSTLTGWVDAGKRNMAARCGLTLVSGQPSFVNVKAKNSGNHWSDVLSKPIFISASSPSLTGKNVYQYK